MPLAVDDGSDTANILSAANHDDIASLKLHMIKHLACVDVQADGVVDLDIWVGVSKSTTVVGHSIRCAFGASHHLLHAAKLVRCLLPLHLVKDKLALGVIEQAEVLFGL